jgi:hypothetical protein
MLQDRARVVVFFDEKDDALVFLRGHVFFLCLS